MFFVNCNAVGHKYLSNPILRTFRYLQINKKYEYRTPVIAVTLKNVTERNNDWIEWINLIIDFEIPTNNFTMKTLALQNGNQNIK